MKNYQRIFYVLFAVAYSLSAFSRQNPEGDFYPLKKDWGIAKDMNEATYFMQLIKENDTTYISRYYNKLGSMAKQEVFLDSELTIPNGRFCWYDANGKLDSTGWVYRRKKNGIWNYFNDNIETTLSIVYDEGRLIEKRNYLKNIYIDATGNKSDLTTKEKKERDAFAADSLASGSIYKNAVFGDPDSSKQWKEYLKKNVSVPKRFINLFETGYRAVTVSFTINKEGITEDIYLMQSGEWSADAEVIKVIQQSPRWAAAVRHGSSADCNQQQTINFQTSLQLNNGGIIQKPSVFVGVQVEAKFPGGSQAWQYFLERNLNTDIPVQNNAPVGEYYVVISFLVQKDGTVGELEILKDPGYGAGEEAIRVFKKSPKWIPATQDGEPVIYRQKQSLTFYVSQR